MAVKYAVADGNWTAGATWNNSTIPAVGDEVYCNGHTITINSNVNIGSGILTNGECPNTNVSGGKVNISRERTITMNLRQVGDNLLIYWTGLSNGGTCSVVGNVENDNGQVIELYHQQNNDFLFQGNISIGKVEPFYYHNEYVYTNRRIEINGNIISNSNYITGLFKESTGNAAVTNFVINGNIMVRRFGKNITNLTINGNCRIINDGNNNCSNLVISGNIEYESTNCSVGIMYTKSLTIINPDTFTWKDITEPRVNPFIIVTNAEMNNRQQYPAESDVKQGTEYVWGEKVGTYTPDYPPESVVLKDYEYGDEDDRKTGTMEQEVNVEVGCVTPEDVRKDVPLVGMGVVGSLVVPSVDDVREGVVFDNGSVGTLIVQGGGDRLRIADFGYYTNAQSDTYIVDLTEQDKPKFAVAEERVLIEMFPDLDLENIPDKYFDDLFVKYLKYRLIVEYYRTAGINSTFTPSEPTTEIVNYQNVRNEVWLNSANIYLKAWSKKYPESITKPQRILL